jgi:DNA-binding response OmpR family regulator
VKRILIIEDDRDIVEFVRYNLANEGLRVTAVADSLVRDRSGLPLD